LAKGRTAGCTVLKVSSSLCSERTRLMTLQRGVLTKERLKHGRTPIVRSCQQTPNSYVASMPRMGRKSTLRRHRRHIFFAATFLLVCGGSHTSKDHRPDLKQLLFILTTAADGGVPVQFRCADGNTSDSVTHIETWNTLRTVAGRADFLYVADSKLCSHGN
jgi:hypothetical protein